MPNLAKRTVNHSTFVPFVTCKCELCKSLFEINLNDFIWKDLNPSICNRCYLSKYGEIHQINNPNQERLFKSRYKFYKENTDRCERCGWNLSSCDIHHIIPKSDGGTNNRSNLIVLCPNCHRLAHQRIKRLK